MLYPRSRSRRPRPNLVVSWPPLLACAPLARVLRPRSIHGWRRARRIALVERQPALPRFRLLFVDAFSLPPRRARRPRRRCPSPRVAARRRRGRLAHRSLSSCRPPPFSRLSHVVITPPAWSLVVAISSSHPTPLLPPAQFRTHRHRLLPVTQSIYVSMCSWRA